MKNAVLAIMTCVCVLLSGCKSVSPQQQAAIDESIPVCNSESDCETKWTAAGSWVLNNTKSTLQIYSDNLIETDPPAKHSASLAARITKKPLRLAGLYQISATVWCDSFLGCEPKIADALLDFNSYVNSAVANDFSDYKNALKKNNYSKPIMGVSLANENPVIKAVYSGSPAEKAGIKIKDTVLQIDGKNIPDQQTLKDVLDESSFGEEIEITVKRGTDILSLKLKFPSENEIQAIKRSDKTISTVQQLQQVIIKIV